MTLLFAVCLAYFAAPCHGQESLPVLTTARSIRSLSLEEAARGYPVRLEGVVTYHNSLRFCFAQDETGPVYVMRQMQNYDLKIGQLVRFEGITEPGLFSPHVRETTATVIGTRELPPAREAGCSDLAGGRLDCERVAISGTVRALDHRWNDGTRLDLQLESEGEALEVHVYDVPKNGSYDSLLDSRVRVYGMATGKFTLQRQISRPVVDAVGIDSVVVEEPASSDPFLLPVQLSGRLLTFALNPADTPRVRVRGVVTYHDPGRVIYIRDESGGLCIQAQLAELLSPGDLIDAVGIPAMGAFCPILTQATYRRVTTGLPAPRPTITTAENILTHGGTADLVCLDAELLNSVSRGTGIVLMLKSNNVLFEGRLLVPATEVRDPNSPQTLVLPQSSRDSLETIPQHGSILRVTGICVIYEAHEAGAIVAPKSFQLLLRGPADIQVIHGPPWWTRSRLLSILGVLLLLIAGAIAWVALLRRRVWEQTRIIEKRGHQEAVLQERHRMAREIHDTLVQGFAGISLQLEAVKDKLPLAPKIFARHIEVAHALARQSMAEARRSIWALHNESILTGGLAASLAASARSITQGSGIETRFRTAGSFEGVPAAIENNLLYIGREAIVNAVKYASPSTIDIEISSDVQTYSLRIRDNGCGFDFAAHRAGHEAHYQGFGLISMRERADQIGAAFLVTSRRGQGTEVHVSVPRKGRYE